jgi:hypothetical protein
MWAQSGNLAYSSTTYLYSWVKSVKKIWPNCENENSTLTLLEVLGSMVFSTEMLPYKAFYK